MPLLGNKSSFLPTTCQTVTSSSIGGCRPTKLLYPPVFHIGVHRYVQPLVILDIDCQRAFLGMAGSPIRISSTEPLFFVSTFAVHSTLPLPAQCTASVLRRLGDTLHDFCPYPTIEAVLANMYSSQNCSQPFVQYDMKPD